MGYSAIKSRDDDFQKEVLGRGICCGREGEDQTLPSGARYTLHSSRGFQSVKGAPDLCRAGILTVCGHPAWEPRVCQSFTKESIGWRSFQIPVSWGKWKRGNYPTLAVKHYTYKSFHNEAVKCFIFITPLQIQWWPYISSRNVELLWIIYFLLHFFEWIFCSFSL